MFLGEPDWNGAARQGYIFKFHAITAPRENVPAEASASSLTGWVLTARPEVQNETGVRGFCVDSKEVIYFTSDGSAPVVDGFCEPSMNRLQ